MNCRPMAMIRKQGLVIPMEVTWFFTPEESAAKSQQDQDQLTVFFDWKGAVHKYAPPGQTINKEYYHKVLRWLRDAI